MDVECSLNIDRPSSIDNTGLARPKKAKFRQRPHCNPLSDNLIPYPITPRHVPWHLYYPSPDACHDPSLEEDILPPSYDNMYDREPIEVSILDIGCGYGSLLIALSDLYPEKYILGMEIREKVTNFARELIISLRKKHGFKKYMNVYTVRTNAMRHLPNYIGPNQLEKIFFCYPDPHFKKSNWRRRIINESLLSLYAYLLKPNGLIYFVTDVLELYEWMINSCDRHKLFVRPDSDFLNNDECFKNLELLSDEGKKLDRLGVPSYKGAYRRISLNIH